MLSAVDRVSLALGDEDNRLGNINRSKSIKLIALVIVCSAVAYIPLKISADRSGGAIEAIRRSDSQSSLNVEMTLRYGEDELVLNPQLTVLSQGQKRADVLSDVQQKSFLESCAEKIVRNLNNDSEGDRLILPEEYEGIALSWNEIKKDDPLWIFAIAAFLSLLIWFSRDDSIKIRERKLRNEFVNELPNMILQLVLLLNAGLIADSAFNELIERNRQSDKHLYKVMGVLKNQSQQANTVFVSELYDYAREFEDRDFLRFATLCAEHSHRGSELASKLEQERTQQWNGRINRAKAKAKEAETKLCFPLMLLLIALVIICIAPALFEM